MLSSKIVNRLVLKTRTGYNYKLLNQEICGTFIKTNKRSKSSKSDKISTNIDDGKGKFSSPKSETSTTAEPPYINRGRNNKTETFVRKYSSQDALGQGGGGGGGERENWSRNVKYASAALGSILASYLIYKVTIKDGPNIDDKKSQRDSLIQEIMKDPVNSELIPSEIKYLLIGGGTASFAALRAIKSHDPKAKILIITKEPYNPYMRPPLSKELFYQEDRAPARDLRFKQWNGVERSLFFEPEEFYTPIDQLLESENGGVSIAKGWEVKKLDVHKKQATLENGKVIHYDKCLIATGGTPQNLPLLETAKEKIKDKVTLYRGTQEFKDVEKMFEKYNPSSVAIIGGGFLGSELATAVAKRGERNKVKITQIVRGVGPIDKIIPSYLSKYAVDKIASECVNFLTGVEVKDILLVDNQLRLILSDDKSVVADHVIVAIGIKPNTDLAYEAGLEVDPKHGGYLVNSHMLAHADVYVAGDCASYYDQKMRERRREEHHDNAVVTGRIAGENMAGKISAYSSEPMFWSEIGAEVGFEALGKVDSRLPTVGVFAKPEPNDADGDSASNKYRKGVVFYLQNNVVVGVLLWNLFNKIGLARQLLKENRAFDDLNDVAKLFDIHGEDSR